MGGFGPFKISWIHVFLTPIAILVFCYFMYILSVQWSHHCFWSSFFNKSLENYASCVLWILFFVEKKCAWCTSQHRNLHLKTTGLFSSGLRWTCILPPPHCFFKCRTQYLLLNVMLASKWPTSLLCVFYANEELC